jgi:peptidoglycan/xylan/chitin deacetylase (PgdA/CDA1 family)
MHPVQVIPTGRASVHVPILMYHYVGRVPPNDSNPRLRAGLTVSPEAFQEQVRWLQANGYHAIDARQLDRYFEGVSNLPARPVMLTFDDGNADLFTNAYPILRQAHMRAVAYIVSGFLGAPGRVTEAQVEEMSRNGIEIGSHTFNHEDLTREPAPRLQMELTRSRQTLQQLIGDEVTDFAYPAGKYDATVQSAAQQAGYTSAMASDASPSGGAPPPAAVTGTAHSWSDRYAWSRIEVNGQESMSQFVASLGPDDPTVQKMEPEP